MKVPTQLVELKLMIKRSQYRHARSERTRELIQMKARHLSKNLKSRSQEV